MAQRVRNTTQNHIRNQENVGLLPGKGVDVGAPVQKTNVKRSALTVIQNRNDKLPLSTVVSKNKPSAIQSKPSSSKLSQPVATAPVKPSTRDLEGVEDIDKDDKNDPYLLSEYVNDIYDYLRSLELQYPIRENYLQGQEVTSRMRSVLIDWLVDVHQQFHLLLETLYLTVAIIDRYLQEVNTTTRKKLQLVGVGSMFVACKYEEMFSPEVGDFVYICDNAYTKEEILSMEKNIIRTLNFNLSRPLPIHFLRRYSKAAHAQSVNHAMAKYILELSLIDYELCHISPSLISAASLYLGLWLYNTEKKAVWTKTLVHYSTYSFSDLKPIVKKLASILVQIGMSKCQAVPKKYSQSKMLKISTAPELKMASLRKLASS
ncbi:G2/mitotic-specific cyclin-B-like [Periplaneta americana]|uniref:G2/mitotic-specific cyclin-B-like n=1 Tax=Periplaneta americana TaxID=6978 RepID=UPI0037E97F89